MDQLVQHQQTINDQLARYGVKFGLYKNGTFQERLFPFDPLPRVITAQEFRTLDEGLVQRVDALNLFLKDVYGDKKIIRDGIVPEDFVFAGSGYLPQCEGFVPPKGVYSHISGIDLVQAKDGSWFILEDNLRIPSGASYPLIARELCRRCSPETFSGNAIVDNRNYAQLLRQTIRPFIRKPVCWFQRACAAWAVFWSMLKASVSATIWLPEMLFPMRNWSRRVHTPILFLTSVLWTI